MFLRNTQKSLVNVCLTNIVSRTKEVIETFNNLGEEKKEQLL